MSPAKKKPEHKTTEQTNTNVPDNKLSRYQRLSLIIPVWVQFIGTLGIVLVALIGSPLWKKISPSETLTPTPTTFITDTPLPTPVVIAPIDTPLPTPQPGKDWEVGCINSAVWKTYLAGETRFAESQCHQLSNWGITAAQGRLTFATIDSQSTAYEYGILTPYNNWSEVDFSVAVERQEHSEIWFGFFEGDTPRSTGIVFVIQPGDVVDIREMPDQTALVDNLGLRSAEGKFNTRAIFEGGKIAVWVDGQVIISKWPVNFTIRNIFIGYRALPSTNLNAEVFGLKFLP